MYQHSDNFFLLNLFLDTKKGCITVVATNHAKPLTGVLGNQERVRNHFTHKAVVKKHAKPLTGVLGNQERVHTFYA